MQPAKASHGHLVQCIGPSLRTAGAERSLNRWDGSGAMMGRLEKEKGSGGREKSGRVDKCGAVVGTGSSAKASVAPSLAGLRAVPGVSPTVETVGYRPLCLRHWLLQPRNGNGLRPCD